jgi:hypothetical protein
VAKSANGSQLGDAFRHGDKLENASKRLSAKVSIKSRDDNLLALRSKQLRHFHNVRVELTLVHANHVVLADQIRNLRQRGRSSCLEHFAVVRRGVQGTVAIVFFVSHHQTIFVRGRVALDATKQLCRLARKHRTLQNNLEQKTRSFFFFFFFFFCAQKKTGQEYFQKLRHTKLIARLWKISAASADSNTICCTLQRSQHTNRHDQQSISRPKTHRNQHAIHPSTTEAQMRHKQSAMREGAKKKKKKKKKKNPSFLPGSIRCSFGLGNTLLSEIICGG